MNATHAGPSQQRSYDFFNTNIDKMIIKTYNYNIAITILVCLLAIATKLKHRIDEENENYKANRCIGNSKSSCFELNNTWSDTGYENQLSFTYTSSLSDKKEEECIITFKKENLLKKEFAYTKEIKYEFYGQPKSLKIKVKK